MSGKSPKPEGCVLGRPTLYRPEYCQMLIDHMAEGYSFESFGATANCTRDTLYEWCRVHEEFSYAKQVGRNFRLKTLEGFLVASIKDKNKYNPVPAMYFLKCCEPEMYLEKQVVKHEVETTNFDASKLSDETLNAIIQESNSGTTKKHAGRSN